MNFHLGPDGLTFCMLEDFPAQLTDGAIVQEVLEDNNRNGGLFIALFYCKIFTPVPRSMALINLKHLTPIPCLILLCIITLSLLITSDVFILINFTSFVESLFIMISVFAVLYLRWKEPDLVRPIKVNIIFPILFFLICGFLVIMPIFEEPEVVGVGLAIIASGVPVYLFFIKLRNRLTILDKIVNILDISLQKFFYALPDLEHED